MSQEWYAVEIKPKSAKIRLARPHELERATRINWEEGIEIYGDEKTARSRAAWFNQRKPR